MSFTLTTRNATLGDIHQVLTEQQRRKHDIVVPATAIRSDGGTVVIQGSEPVLDDTGVTVTDGRYRPLDVYQEGLASKINVPGQYMKRLAADRPDVYDATVNGLLHGTKAKVRFHTDGEQEQVYPAAPADPRSFLIRLFLGENGEPGVARALLSDKYAIFDNLDVVMAVLEGLTEAGMNESVEVRADLSERRLYLLVRAPEVCVYVPDFLRGYRSPFTGQTGDDLPILHAGIVIRNSEIGQGALSIHPEAVVKVCSNGMTITQDVMRRVHLGARMDDGVIQWSSDTRERNAALVQSQVKDAVTTFLNVEYMQQVAHRLTEVGVKPIADPAAVIQTVSKSLRYSDEQQAGILAMFVRGGQMTSGGIAQAITAYSQTVEDADVAHALNASAIQAMMLA